MSCPTLSKQHRSLKRKRDELKESARKLDLDVVEMVRAFKTCDDCIEVTDFDLLKKPLVALHVYQNLHDHLQHDHDVQHDYVQAWWGGYFISVDLCHFNCERFRGYYAYQNVKQPGAPVCDYCNKLCEKNIKTALWDTKLHQPELLNLIYDYLRSMGSDVYG